MRAASCLDLVQQALVDAGDSGLGDIRGPVRFACRWEPVQQAPLSDYCGLPDPMPRLAELRFITPCQTPARNLPELLGNTAHDIAQWALLDAGLSGELGKRGCDAVADAARLEAAASVQGLGASWLDRDEVVIGRRRSRSNGGAFDLRGFVGCIALAGDLSVAWPWLALLALRGAGGRGGFGLGRVQLSASQGESPAVAGNPRPLGA